MSQLHTFIQSLNPEELTLLRKLPLIGKEKEVFDLLLLHRLQKLPEIDEIVLKLKLSNSHYYKINSILMEKSFHQLVPEGDLKLLQFLRSKGLFTLLRHELIALDKRLQKEKKEDEALYLSCFHLLIDFPYKYYDKKLLAHFGATYLKAKKNASESDRLYVKYHMLFSEINLLAARKNPKKALKTTINELLLAEKKLEKTPHALACYYLYRCITSYYTYYEGNKEQVMSYLRKAIALKNEIAYFFPVNIGQFLQLLLADVLFGSGKLNEAFSTYKTIFDEGLSGEMYGYYYHCEQYILLLTIHENYTQAEQLLDTVFQTAIDQEIDIYATRGAMSYCKLFLSTGQYKEGMNYLNRAKNINEKTFYLPFDIQLRFLETMYFLFRNDSEFAQQLCTRNIKFAVSQEQPGLMNDYLLFWKNINSWIVLQRKELTITAELRANFLDFESKYRYLYCNLVSKWLNSIRD